MNKNKSIFINYFFFIFILLSLTFSNSNSQILKDNKGKLFILILENWDKNQAHQPNLFRLTSQLNRRFQSDNHDQDINIVIFKYGDNFKSYQDLSSSILNMNESRINNIGGILHFIFNSKETPDKDNNSSSIVIENYHYPFLPIAEEHIESPEYTFKFASDSSLLSILLFEAIKQSGEIFKINLNNINIKPSESIDVPLTQDLLKKYTKILLTDNNSLLDQNLNLFSDLIFTTITNYCYDDKIYMIGMISEKTKRYASPNNLEVRITKYTYPDKEIKEGEKTPIVKEEPIITVKPFSSYLFYFSNLNRITPYSYKIIDISKNESDLRYELDKGAFLTSDLGGIVRTIPNKFKNYKPLIANTILSPEMKITINIFSYVIEGATIIDGTNKKKPYVSDVGIIGDKIIKIGNLKKYKRENTIDGKGLFLTPGFIDIHSHADSSIFRAPYAQSSLGQGITTVLGGNCSFSPQEFGVSLKNLETSGTAINFGCLLGNKPVRKAVMGSRQNLPTYEEIYRQKELVDLAMEEGAFGLSTGLIYAISENAYTLEIAELAKQVKPYGGFYASHVRGETDEVLDAIREGIFIGEIAEVPVQISHMKTIGKANWGNMNMYIKYMKDAQKRGIEVTGDQYPWLATGASYNYKLLTLINREAIKRDSPETVLLKEMPGKYNKYSGKLLSELLEEEKITPEDLIKDLNLTDDSKIYATYLCLSEKDLLLPMKEDFVMVVTDAGLKSQEEIDKNDYDGEHPRKFGSFPEFLSKYVRDKNVCSWELAIYKCSGLPAKRMKLADRGVIKEGCYADLVLFDPIELDTNVDYIRQDRYPKGINYVFVNGQPALKEGKFTYLRNGKVLFAYGNKKP